jgi:di/tricarboxylate transporter
MLVVNTPNTMIAYGSKTFTARQFMIAGLINTIISLVMITLFTATYWHWLGII